MLLKRNLLESVTIISCSGTIICVLLNYLTNISPITGICFHVYILFLFIVSVFLSFKFIQWLLHLNKPLKYDLEGLLENYPYLSILSRYLPQANRNRKKDEIEESREYDTNELSIITTVLERKLVSSWYFPYISQEIGFPFACKQMLDQMIGMTFQICNKIESKEVFVDISSILTTHLKEYRKALKRHEKSPDSTIESLYKKSHPISDVSKKYTTADHCTNILRIILKELVPWELWDTPHSELLVRILSKMLDNFIDSTLANPDWLNDKLLTVLNAKDEIKTEAKMNENKSDIENKAELSQFPKEVTAKEELITQIPKPDTTTIECALSTLITKSTAPILQRDINEEIKTDTHISKDKAKDNTKDIAVGKELVEMNSSPILRQKRGRQGRNEVKIYDRIIEGSVKTWETDIDLQCISLGQDLLASLDGEITLSRLWGQDAEPDGSPNPPRGSSPQPLWFGEEDSLEMELADTSPQKESRSPVKKEFGPKPADAILKDIQTTVHQAKSKIGDLQVHKLTNVDRVNRKRPNDEAAGMMEGLLDFGIAGLKKGLRFTGLSDDSQDKSPSHHKERAYKISPPDTSKANTNRPAIESKEQITSTVIQKDENGGSSVPPLVKQHRVTSQDSVPSQPKPILKGEGIPPTVLPADSPEPEYEEAADLSTSIAKLRSLLQQRAQSSPPTNEDMWWESAEETQGHTQRHHSSRPVDTATLADEYDMKCERNSSPEQAVNNRQRLDKLFQRTVTDVFNSIKTAVGVEGDEVTPHPLHEWTHVCTSVEDSVGGMVARLVGSRRAYAHVDAALDSLQHLALPPKKRELAPEDFEEWCVYMAARWCGASEAACAAQLWSSHVAHRIATVLLADLAESLINVWLKDFTAWLKNQVFVVFEQMSKQSSETGSGAKEKIELRHFNVDETCDVVMKKIPKLYVFGEETLMRAVKLSLSSFSHQELNRDLVFRLLDILAFHFKMSAALRNPSFDAN